MKEKIKIKSKSGKELSFRIWKKDNSDYKGIVQIVHGMQEHIDRYSRFAEFLVDNGYIVIGHDQLGHGETVQNEEDYGHFENNNGWEYLVDDIHNVYEYIRKEYPNLKYILFGHSMGSLLVRKYIIKYKDNIDKVILSGTSGQKAGLISGIVLIEILKLFFGKRYKSKLIEYLVIGSFNKKIENAKTKADWISRDEEEVLKFVNDEKCLKDFTLQAYEDLLKGTLYVSKQKNINNSLNVSILIISGDNDPVGEMSKGVIRVYKMYEKAKLDVDIRLIKDARHEILNELDKEYVYNFILRWIEK